MPRPKNKTELLSLSQKNFDLLLGFIENLPKEEQLRVINKLIKNVSLQQWKEKLFVVRQSLLS